MRFHQLSMPVRCHLMFHAFLYLAAISLSFVSAAIRKAWKRIWNLYSRAKVGFLFFLMRPAITIKIPNTPDGSISLACPGHACNTKVKKPKERKDTQEMNVEPLIMKVRLNIWSISCGINLLSFLFSLIRFHGLIMMKSNKRKENACRLHQPGRSPAVLKRVSHRSVSS